MNDEQKEKWRIEFNNLWLDFEMENGHIRSPANKYAFKTYIAARMTSQVEYDSILKLLHEHDCRIEELEYKLALAKEALEFISALEEDEEFPATRISKAAKRSRETLEKLK